MHCRGSQALVPQGARCECCEHFSHFNSAKTFRCLKVLPSESAVRVLDWSSRSGMLQNAAQEECVPDVWVAQVDSFSVDWRARRPE